MAGFLIEIWDALMEGMQEAKREDDMKKRQKMADDRRYDRSESESGKGSDGGGESHGGDGDGSDVENAATRISGEKNKDGDLKSDVNAGDHMSPVPGIRKVDTWGGIQRRGILPASGPQRQLQRRGTAPGPHGMASPRPPKTTKTSDLGEVYKTTLNRARTDTTAAGKARRTSGEEDSKKS